MDDRYGNTYIVKNAILYFILFIQSSQDTIWSLKAFKTLTEIWKPMIV